MLDSEQPSKRRKNNVGKAERRKNREERTAAELERTKGLLAQFAEANQASSHAASLTASVASQFANLYTSSSLPQFPFSYPLSQIPSASRQNTSVGAEPPNKNLRENSRSSVTPFEREEEPIRDTPYSPEQRTSLSPLQSLADFPIPDESSFVGFHGADYSQNPEEEYSEPQSRSTRYTDSRSASYSTSESRSTRHTPSLQRRISGSNSRSSQSFYSRSTRSSRSTDSYHTSIPQGPARRYDSYRPNYCQLYREE
jgi:hypothetical protein